MSNDEPTSSSSTSTEADYNSIINAELEKLIEKYSINEETLNEHIESVFQDTFNEVIFGFAIQIHRAAKLGYLFVFDPIEDENKQKDFEITNYEDIFNNNNQSTTATTSSRSNNTNTGSSNNNNNNNLSKYECKCPNCNRTIVAIRFAPHLEKCMGLGRSSSRIATRRIASYNYDDYDDQYFYDQESISSSSSSNLIDLDSNNQAASSIVSAATGTGVGKQHKRKRLQASASMQNLTTK